MFTKRLNLSSAISGMLPIILTTILLVGYQESSIASTHKDSQVIASLSQSTEVTLSSSSLITSTVTPSPTPSPSSTITSTIASPIPYDEAIDGALSDDPLSPNQFTLSMGMNPITATLTQEDIEYFSITVPDGMVVNTIMLNSYEATAHWATPHVSMSIQEGLIFKTQVTATADLALVGNIKFREYHEQNEPNILTYLSVPYEDSCSKGPLTSGSYAMQLSQHSGDTTTYSLNFVVTKTIAQDTLLPIVATSERMQGSACSNIEWMREDLGDFSLSLPVDMVDQEEQGIDSLVGRYKKDGMELYFDYGMWTRPPLTFCYYPNYSITAIELSGKPAKISSLRSENGNFEYGASLYVANVVEHNGEFIEHLDMSIGFNEANDKEIARCILESVRFPE